MTTPETVLDVEDLTVTLATDDETVHAVNGVSFRIAAAEALAVVGESGSGKSVTALAVMGLLPGHAVRGVTGSIRYRGNDLLGLRGAERRRLRGREIAMIYQDPMTSLNPVMTVGQQLMLVLRRHLGLDRRAARARAVELLDRVQIAGAEKRLDSYPHQLSGGQRQRVLIALALACRPSLLIADEPTTALDVTVQAEIIGLVDQLRTEFGMAVLWITHDLGVVARFADRALVMYGGRVVEEAPAQELFATPRHPYTSGLLDSLPRFDGEHDRLRPIAGAPTTLAAPPEACVFRFRCPAAADVCTAGLPPLVLVAPAHGSACVRHDELYPVSVDGERG